VAKKESNVKEETGTEAETGSPAVCGSEPKAEAKPEKEEIKPSLGMGVTYRLKRQLYGAIITGYAGTTVDLTYFSVGSGYTAGATNVKKGLGSNNWWPNDRDMRIALSDLP
jgi:hypothetical protein